MKKSNMKKVLYPNLLLGGFVITMLAMLLIGGQSAHALISTQLDFGDRGSEVTELQSYLSTDANIYPSKLVTGYFGPLTRSGVERFQNKEGIVSSGTPLTTGYGRVGPITRAAINAKLSGSTVTPTGDINAPVVRTVGVSTGSGSATINWTTNESSFGKVYYSTTPIQIRNVFDITGRSSGQPDVSGTLAQFDSNKRLSHTVNLTGLASNTTYYYLVVVYDSSGNVSFTSPANFRTQ